MVSAKYIFSPGPVPAEYKIRIDFSHRSKRFEQVYSQVTSKLKKMAGKEVLLIQGSGSAAIEAAISSFCRGKEVIVFTNGTFGDRACKLISQYSRKTVEVRTQEEAIEKIKRGAGVFFMVQFETSVSRYNDADELCSLCKKRTILTIIDCVSGYPFYPLPDADVIITSSSKLLRGFPAMGIIFYTKEAKNRMREYGDYLNLRKYIEYAERNQTPHTALIPQMMSLQNGLKIYKRYVNHISENSRIITRRREAKVIGELVAPVITFRVKKLTDAMRLFQKYGIEPYVNKSYMSTTIQFSTYNYAPETYKYLDKIISEAESRGFM